MSARKAEARAQKAVAKDARSGRWAKDSGAFKMTGLRKSILSALEDNGGAIEDRSGRAVGVLFDKAGATNQKALANTLAAMERAGVIEREIRGRRTFAVKLVGVGGVGDATAGTVKAMGIPASVVVEKAGEGQTARVEAWESETGSQGSMGGSDVDYPTLADALLVRVTDILARGAGEQAWVKDRDGLLSRLGDVVEEGQRLRSQVRLLEDELSAVRYERDGLRARVTRLEANVAALTNPRNRIFDDVQRREIKKVMETAPKARG